MRLKKLAAGFFAAAFMVASVAFVKPDEDPIIKKIIDQLEGWLTNHPQEKVYLQFDKPYYGIGDNIWMKGYITVGPQHRLSAMSGALNVELINEQDSVKQWIKLPITNGITWGDFALSDTLPEGRYRVRAYTNWMRNAGPDYFFEKALTIGTYSYSQVNTAQKVDARINYTDLDNAPYAGKEVNYTVHVADKQVVKGKGQTDAQGNLPVSFINATPTPATSGWIETRIKVSDKKNVTKTIRFSAASGKVDVQFFPESGSLVNGIRSLVAFKAVGPDGMGVNIKGIITDNENRQLAVLNTRHLGMGVFALVPEAGKTYQAQVTYPDGSKSTIALPQAVNEGYVLSINNTDTATIGVRITGSNNVNTQNIYLVAQSSGTICYVAKNNGTSKTFSAALPKSRFPSGVAQFTLFSSTGEPLNERIAFIQRQSELLKMSVSTDQPASATRQKVKVNLTARDAGGKPVIGTFSASVIDESKVPTNEADETSILSQLLLSADIKGYIEQPNYYFTQPNENTAADLDVLMLTQGYRRFSWKPLLTNQLPALQFKAEKSLQITGTLKTSGGKPVPKGKIMLFTTAGGTFVLDTVADAQGRFAFKDLIFRDSIRFVLQARNAKGGKNIEIVLDKTPVPSTAKSISSPNIPIGDLAALNTYLKFNKKLYDEEAKYGMGNHAIVLKEVTVTEKRKVPSLAYSSNLNGAGNADQVVTSELFDKIGCPTIEQCLQGRLTGVIFRNGIPYSTRTPRAPMQVIVDGMYVEGDFLQNIPPMTIASVEVLRTIGTTAIYGGRGGSGVLIVNTKRGGDYTYNASQIYSPGILTYVPKGYYNARQFYAPKYDDPKTNTALADLRTTIHWVPNLVTDSSGQASFEFYNAGSPGTYRILVEGINADGYIGRQIYHYQVR
jgi:hypothetical protein